MPPKLLTLIALFFAALFPVHAQQAKDRVAGRVVSSLDGHPIAHATVTLSELTASIKPLSTTADDDGEFNFPPVPPGNYNLVGSAPGYLTLSYEQHDGYYTGVVTGAGLATDALVLRIEPASTIAGHIVDEVGDPVQHAQIALYRETSGHISRVNNTQSDTGGEYEFGRLAPGRYFLTVSATPWYAVHPRADQPQEVSQYRIAVDPALDVAYPLTFYPRALDSTGATPIILEGGNQFTADMQLSPEPAVSISLHAASGNAVNQRIPNVTQSVFGTDEQVPIQMTENLNGTIRLPGFAPGRYKVEEFTPDGRFPALSAPVDLTTGSVTVELATHTNLATVSVTLHGANGESLPAHMQLLLRGTSSDWDGNLVQADKNTVELSGVPPGDYRPRVAGGGHEWNVITLAVNGKASPDRLLHITAGGAIPVDLTISSSIGGILGKALRDGKPADGSMIVLVPAGGDLNEDLFRRDQTNLDGSFALGNIVPGNYLLVAIDDGWTLRWNDATALTTYLLHAVPISIPATGSPTIHLSEPLVTQPR